MRVDRTSPKMKFRYRRLRSWKYYFWNYIAIISSVLYIGFVSINLIYVSSIDWRRNYLYDIKQGHGYDGSFQEYVNNLYCSSWSCALGTTIFFLLLLVVVMLIIFSIIKLIDKCLKIHTTFHTK